MVRSGAFSTANCEVHAEIPQNTLCLGGFTPQTDAVLVFLDLGYDSFKAFFAKKKDKNTSTLRLFNPQLFH